MSFETLLSYITTSSYCTLHLKNNCKIPLSSEILQKQQKCSFHKQISLEKQNLRKIQYQQNYFEVGFLVFPNRSQQFVKILGGKKKHFCPVAPMIIDYYTKLFFPNRLEQIFIRKSTIISLY